MAATLVAASHAGTQLQNVVRLGVTTSLACQGDPKWKCVPQGRNLVPGDQGENLIDPPFWQHFVLGHFAGDQQEASCSLDDAGHCRHSSLAHTAAVTKRAFMLDGGYTLNK